MSRFKVGDRVEIIKAISLPWLVGQRATVVAPLAVFHCDRPHEMNGKLTHDLDIEVGHYIVSAPPEFLRLVPDDGHERGEWDELTLRLCKPEEVPA